MKERQDDVLLTVKESPPVVDSTKADENVTKTAKIEGVLMAEKEEGEDTMVDVVGADVVVADHQGGTKVDLDGKVAFNGSVEEGSKTETETRDQVMEDAGVVELACDVTVESKEKVEVVVSEEGAKTSVEVSKEVIQENVVADVASGLDCDDKKSVGTESGSTKEIVEEQSIETVQEVADKDEKNGKEDEASNSSENAESLPTTTDLNIGSQEGDVVAEEEGLIGKDKSEDGVKNETLSTEVADAGTGEDNVNLSTKKLNLEAGVDQISAESSQPITEVAPNDGQEPENGTKVEDSKTVVESLNEEPQLVGEEVAIKKEESKRDITEETPVESVQEVADVDHVMNEETGNDEVLESEKIPVTVIKVDEEVVNKGSTGKDEAKDCVSNVISSDAKTGEGAGDENLDQKVEIDQMRKEDSSNLTIEVKIDNAEKSEKETEVEEDSKMDDESTNKDTPSVKDEIILTDKEKEPESGSIVEPPVDSAQQAANEDHLNNEKSAKEDENLDSGGDSSTKIPESSTMEEVDVEGLEEKDKAENVVSDRNMDVSEAKESTCPPADDKSKTDVDANKVDEVTPIIGESSNIQEDQGLKDEIPGIDPLSGEHGVLPTGSVFSYEEAHMERGEDAGMDIDEVLGWKDEIEQQDQKVEDFCRNQEIESLDHSTTFTDEVTETETETSVSLHQSCYFHPPENEGEFSVSDLVWGKVRSHPWWPGQIFDPSDASEKAMKHHKKDCFLVAYFGDRTFAWNDSSVLKPFRAKFSQIEKHGSSEAFNNAVDCALEEVSRRVELGLSCSCVSNDVYEKIKCQIVENAGIRQESSRRHGVDKSASVSSFEPDKLVDYVKLLAKSPYGEGDKLEITMAKAQLSCYGRFKGYRQLAEFLFCGDLLEDSSVINEKEKNLSSELTVDAETYSGEVAPEGNVVSSPGSKKRKAAVDSVSDNSEKRQSLNPETIPLASKPSFKVGECIQRVASQLTGGVDPVDQPIESPGKLSNQSYPPEMLSQLHLFAQDPTKGYTFLNTIIPFFNTHRSAVISKLKRESTDGRKRKPSNENDPEDFEFDDVNDSYWTDRIIQNYPEEQLLQENQNGGGEQHQIVAYEQQPHNNNDINNKPVKPTRRSNKKRFFSSNHEIEAKEQSELIERRRQNLATEVLMKYPEGIYFPSEIQLNKMFKRFGPLLESETEVDRQSCRARVVFKKCSDAEVAHSSAGKFNIFGSISVNYELNYTPLISYKPLPLALPQDPANAC